MFTARVEEKSPTTFIYVQKAERIDQLPDRIEILMPNAAYQSSLDTPEHRAVLSAVAAEVAGKAMPVSVIIKAQATAAAPTGNSSMDSAREEPLVKKFLEVFRGDLANVKPVKEE